MGFGAVISGAGSEVLYWMTDNGVVDRYIRGIVVFTIIPIFLIWLNSRGVKVSSILVQINPWVVKLRLFVYLSCTAGLE